MKALIFTFLLLSFGSAYSANSGENDVSESLSSCCNEGRFEASSCEGKNTPEIEGVETSGTEVTSGI